MPFGHLSPLMSFKEDPPDNRILECAVSAGSDFIVTGDKDVLRLGSYDSIRIITVSDFLGLGPGRILADLGARACGDLDQPDTGVELVV